jgi:hypothetical protein
MDGWMDGMGWIDGIDHYKAFIQCLVFFFQFTFLFTVVRGGGEEFRIWDKSML